MLHPAEREVGQSERKSCHDGAARLSNERKSQYARESEREKRIDNSD